ncbi:hypothetical protein CBR_g29942 [Chara braunii]|uniref:Uncharacterized protein n=1 Tax=Chara braunii TaxID=69332 RepID=A0A388LBH4_CHABU|nr:hypothetical protein CBR_g29942 [Chara braunii]|eukprot:GBG79677.1 hypothetical protein CBR_g29942 [Chara braunii]
MARRRLGLLPRLAVLGAFNLSVLCAYLLVIERSKNRGGSYSKDGYDYWEMFRKPKHIREAENSAEK